MSMMRAISRGSLILIMVLVSILFLLASGSLSAMDRKEILVGTHLPLSGALATIGIQQKWAYETAVKDINKKGGIYVREYRRKLPVRLVLIDDETDPGKAAAAVERLAKQKKVDMILSGHTAAFGVVPGAVAAEKHKIYYHATASFIPPWKQHHFNWSTLFFVDLDETTSIPFRLLNSIPETERPKRLGLVTEDNFDGRAIRKYLQKQAENYDYEIVFDMPWTPSGKDYTSQILKAKHRKVDSLLVFGGTTDMITFIRQMEQERFNVKFMLVWKGAWPAEFWEGLGKRAQYILSDGHWSEDYPFPGSKYVGQRYYQEFNKKSVSVGAFYALAQILWQAIEKAGSLDSKQIRRAVLDNTFETVMGEIDYDSDGVGIYPAPVFQWFNGKQRIIYPFKYSTYKLQLAPSWNER